MSAALVVGALYDVFTLAAPGRQVFYGEPAESEWTDELATWVAYSDGETPDVSIIASPAQEDGSQQLAVTVECAASIYVGSDDVRSVLVAVDAHMESLRAAVNADRTLNGVAISAEFGLQENLSISRAEGVRVLYLFSVEVLTWSR